MHDFNLNFNSNLFDEKGPVNKLIDKLSTAVGWTATRNTEHKIAVAGYIEDIQNSDYDPMTKAALISNAGKAIRTYRNQAAILQLAAPQITSQPSPDQIDDDWLTQFMEGAGRISNDVFQTIWARILANECNEPGKMPRSLFYILNRMEKDEAEAFTKLCSITIYNKNEMDPLIIGSRFEEYARFGIKYPNLVDLVALGLIETSLGGVDSGYIWHIEEDDERDVIFYSQVFHINQTLKEIPVGSVLYTKTGKALFRCIETEAAEGFWEEFVLPHFTHAAENTG